MKKKLVKYPFLTRDVEIYERENGHKIVLAHKEGDMVNVSSWVKTGSINENDKNNGISHFLEHLMFKGTHKHKAGEFDKILEAKGAIVNAATWKDYTFYYVTLPKGDGDENFNTAIELHADMMTDPVIPDYEMGAPFDVNDKTVTDKRERHVVIEEIRMRKDQPWTKVYNATNHAMYTSHPYKRDVIGTPEIISQVSQQEIMDYYRTFYSPKNVTTIVVGDFDSDLKGAGSHAEVKVIAISTGKQVQGIDTRVTNYGKHSIGHILQHGVILAKSALIFNGIGHIIHGAKGADAQQESRVLMLSTKARGDANPILLIDDNDVSAGHAASVGRVDQSQLYYLMSRGLPQKIAERLVIRGFLGPVLTAVPNVTVRRQLSDMIEEKLVNGQADE